MQTHIGRVVVSTIATRNRGFVIWETAIVIYFPDADGHWCQTDPAFELLGNYLTEWEAFIGHAFIVGWLRVGLELEAGAPARQPLRLVAIGAPFRGLLARALAPRCLDCPWQVEAARLPALGAEPPVVKS
jgi:hypothetical protein